MNRNSVFILWSIRAERCPPPDIRDETSTTTFKKKLKTFCFSLAFGCV